MTTRWIPVLALLSLLIAPATHGQDEGGEPRNIDLRQAPPSFRLGVRVLTHRHVRQASPVLVIADSPEAYVEAIARWTDRTIFPVLIDDGSWRAAEDIGRFTRAFQPEKIVRVSADKDLPVGRAARQEKFERVLAGIWGLGKPETAAGDVMPELVSHLQYAVHLPPGIVVADSYDPVWPGALALAAGHAQPIMWYDRSSIPEGVDSVIGQAKTKELADAIEMRLEELGMPWQTLGDMVDAVTICLNIPVKCRLNMGENESERFALTDVIGQHRAFSSPRGQPLQRWAWAGQMFGGESTSAYRAMCSLFLQPRQAWIFDGYPTSEPWSAYSGKLTVENLAKAKLPATLIDAPRNGIDTWQASTTKALDADLVFVNCKGMADYFDLEPGRAYASDVPVLDRPAAVSYVHSWSATRPAEPTTVGGAWIDAGAFMYLGSVHEPYLQAFIPTPIFGLRLMGGLPWGAACRPDASSPIWKIAVLGDPLLAVGSERPRTSVIEIEDGREIADEITKAIKAEDFAGVVRRQVMLGHDEEVVRLASAIRRDKPEAFDANLAKLVAMPAFREFNVDLLVECALLIEPEELAQTRIGPAVWHIAESQLRTGVDVKLASALERSLAGPSIVRDASRLASAVEISQGVNIRNVLLDRIADGVSDANTAREIRRAKR